MEVKVIDELPSGQYYVGDLCYLLSDEDYDNIVLSFRYDNQSTIIEGVTSFHGFTAYGDGNYSDNMGFL